MTATATANYTLSVFTDPMMGLSYESEPVLEKLQAHFGKSLQIRYIMAGLVRDVSDFMTPAERAMEPERGIKTYNRRLAGIYLAEEPLGGLPMKMDHFHLFDAKHRSSFPLDIACKAAELTDASKAEAYLYALRRATILEAKQTTKEEELFALAKNVGLDEKVFQQHWQDGSAKQAFDQDRQYAQSLQVFQLPAYLIACQNKEQAILVKAMPSYQEFLALFQQAANA